MLFSTALLVAASAWTGLVAAQNDTSAPDVTISPDSVPITTRQNWCRSQKESCPEICGGIANENECDPNQLTFVCECADGSNPNITDFAQTLPSLICDEWFEQCIDQNTGNAQGQEVCMSVVCGQRDPADVDEGESSATASGAATATATASASSSATDEAASTTEAAASATSSDAAVALHIAQNYGSGVLAAGLFALFGFVA
ncbi:hypothetical protein BDY21DRAFT_345779 [Lineolata rhizophorae]|uniref:DUF7707 domain-containing protein n=1 Tax=Lineolata rhizophorae TaxID=578093 RepID=A0A6A6NYT6_9PEZI|nr:hypothetical protein BDY21DRAFT_345779 [Lineolata rhizophorae]